MRQRRALERSHVLLQLKGQFGRIRSPLVARAAKAPGSRIAAHYPHEALPIQGQVLGFFLQDGLVCGTAQIRPVVSAGRATQSSSMTADMFRILRGTLPYVVCWNSQRFSALSKVNSQE